MTPAAWTLLLLCAGAPGTRLELTPGQWSHNDVVYAHGSLWLAVEATVWRYGADGVGESHTLPDGAHARQLFPRGGTVDLHLDYEVARITGESLNRIVGFDESVTSYRRVAAIGDGYAALSLSGELTYHRGRGGAVVIRPETCTEAEEELSCRPVEPPLRLRGGTLVSVADDRLGWVRDNPYEILTFGLDGRVRVLRTEPESPLAREAAAYTPDGAKRPMVRTRRVVAAAGRLFVSRIVYDLVRMEDDSEFAGLTVLRPTAYLDVITVPDGELVKRAELLRGDEEESLGVLVGLRDPDTVVLLAGDFRRDADGKPIGADADPLTGPPGWRSWLRFVKWRDLPDRPPPG